MAKNEDCKDGALASVLLYEFQQAYAQKLAAESEMERIKARIVNELCTYKLGMEFVDRRGIHAVLTEIKTVDSSLQGGPWGEPRIAFGYNFRKVRKDGHLSLNNYYISLRDSLFTGKVWNLDEED